MPRGRHAGADRPSGGTRQRLTLHGGRTMSGSILAITVTPGEAGSARLTHVDEPRRGESELLLDMIALGICGTDREIVAGEYGWSPPGGGRLVLGHESLGRVREAPPGSELQPGDLVAGIVRRPDPDPCPCCARGEFDMCRNGRYRERGIKELDGYGAERVALERRLRRQGRPRAGLARRPHRAGQRGRQGVGAGRPGGRAGVPAAGERAGHRRRAHRLARGAPGGPARPPRRRPRSRGRRAQAGAGHGCSVPITTAARCRRSSPRREPDIVVECTGDTEVVVQAISRRRRARSSA